MAEVSLPASRALARAGRASPRRRAANSARIVAYVLLSLGGFCMLLPFLWLLSSSLKGPDQVFLFPPQWVPTPAHWDNYPYVVRELPFETYLKNTLIITVGAVVGQVLSSTVSAYSFARLRWWGRDVVFALILATLMLPYVVTLIPVYILFKDLHWINTFLPLIVPPPGSAAAHSTSSSCASSS